ncbi:hypothetical protein GCM10022224_075700 [Nonomuraea antimicrobica]|uniref:Lipoprotein n=1 Tax=Nonomuraea antimicrobica TaxID=561173 RepID=A0ABP7D2W2_9ACTN
MEIDMKSILGQKRSRRSIMAAVALAAFALTGAACGGGQEPGGGSVSFAPKGEGDPAAYAKCMRENGVPSFPDPGTEGAVVNKDEANTPEFKKAEETCKKHQPQSSPSTTLSKTGGS